MDKEQEQGLRAALAAGMEAFRRGEPEERNPFDAVSDEAEALMWATGWARAQSAELREEMRAELQRLNRARAHRLR